MRRGLAAAIGAGALLLASPAYGHPGAVVTDDPHQHEHSHDEPTLFDGDGVSSVEARLGDQPAAPPGPRAGRNVTFLGGARGDHFNEGVYGDVAGYKKLAFLGKWRGGCPGSGVDIIDISRPATPRKMTDTLDHADTSMEDMQAIQIGARDVLAVGLQDCGNDPAPGVGKSGLELYDITDPRSPRRLSFVDVDSDGVDNGGVHELDLTAHPNGRTYALGSVPDGEARSSDAEGRGGQGDLFVWDVTDPANPVQVSEWGVLDEPALGVETWLSARQGGDARTQLHSVRASKDGTRAYLSYWDAGYIVLDLADPAQPRYLGRTSYAPGEEGNAHSVATARDETLMVAADEDFTPFEFQFSSNAFSGTRLAIEGTFTPPVVEQPARAVSGDVVHVGQGCPVGSITGSNPADPYLADPRGKVALVERGGCRFDHKVARAQQAGAVGVVVYNSAAGGEALISMGGNNPAVMPDLSQVPITIPSVFVQRSTGVLLRDGTAPVTAKAAAVFNGWGHLRIVDISNPEKPVQLSTFATPNANNEAVATAGTWSVHNPEVVGSTVYASWYSDGVRVIDIARPTAPKEVGFWTGAGLPADAPAVDIWSVVPHNGLLLASDRNAGLYVLSHSQAKP